MRAQTGVHRIDLGYFVRPAEETGTGSPRVEPCLAYLVRHAQGVLLLDTGMGSHPEVDAHYRPRRRPLGQALAEVGLDLDDVDVLTNCHLHFDHCGGNPLLTRRPVLAQRTELEWARNTPDYTLPELIDVPGQHYELLDGETEVWPGVLLVPTPGHTHGHQSLVVRLSSGVVVVAGQSHDSATAFGTDVLALQARRQGFDAVVPEPPAWLESLLTLDPLEVVFAHDLATWRPTKRARWVAK